jgi:Tol biopolymer transport system component
MTNTTRATLILCVGLFILAASPTRLWAQPQLDLVSVATDGTPAQLETGLTFPVFSGNGRFVAFTSPAANLVDGDTNGVRDVFVRDLLTRTTARVSVGSDGHQGDENSDYSASLNYDGTLVAFGSQAGLDSPHANTGCKGFFPTEACTDIYLRDRTRGLTTVLSVAANGGAANNHSSDPRISADGRFVVFTSAASNLVPGDTNGVVDVFLRDLAARTTTRLSVTSTGGEATAASLGAHISANGSVVAFVSEAILAGDPDPTCRPNYCRRAYVLDRTTGVLTRVPIPATGLSSSGGIVDAVDLTPDGRLIAVSVERLGEASNGLSTTMMFIYDRQTQQTEVLAERTGGGGEIAISASGRFVSIGFGVLRGGFMTAGLTFDRQTHATVPASDLPPATYVFDPAVQYTADGLRALIVQNSRISLVSHDADLDGLPDAWETQFGLNPNDPADAAADADGDGASNLQEYFAGTQPKGAFKRYFAEGAANSFFSTRFALFNPTDQNTTAIVELLGANGQFRSTTVPLAPHGWGSVTLNESTLLQPDQDFSTIIESDAPIVADRTMSWDKSGYGSHAETSMAAPSTTWYLAEGSTGGSFDLFYLLQNPGDTIANVTVNYLLPAPQAPIVKHYAVAPKSRLTIYVDQEGDTLAATDVSAKITADQPILAERAMYFSTPTQAFAAGHEGAAVDAPATSWFFAEGATGSFFDLFLLLANAEATDATVQITYLLPDGSSIVKTYNVAAQSRLTINVDFEDPALKDTPVSAIVESKNAVPIIAERAMWWPSPNWYEAHLSAGATTTGTRWALAEGLVTTTPGTETETYFLIANTSTTPGTADVTLYLADGTSTTRTFTLPATSRTNVQVRAEFPDVVDKGGFGTIIQSSGPQIVVERAMYNNAAGQVWAAGTDALGTKLQ